MSLPLLSVVLLLLLLIMHPIASGGCSSPSFGVRPRLVKKDVTERGRAIAGRAPTTTTTFPAVPLVWVPPVVLAGSIGGKGRALLLLLLGPNLR